MRKLVEFPCSGEQLVGSFDAADGPTGVLIVSGGNEVRAGAHRGMAMLAERLAAADIPVFRFDRRGVGDSSGPNLGYEGSRPDIIAAINTFRHLAPKAKRLIGFGNCDAATALLKFGHELDRLVLANPWLGGTRDGLPPADAIRAHYADRIRDPGTWARALAGGVNFGKLLSGLSKIGSSTSQRDVQTELAVFRHLRSRADVPVLIASGDATGIAFLAAARRRAYEHGIRLIETNSHSFARQGDGDAVYQAIRDAIDD